MSVDYCACCGEIIPESGQVCFCCEKNISFRDKTKNSRGICYRILNKTNRALKRIISYASKRIKRCITFCGSICICLYKYIRFITN